MTTSHQKFGFDTEFNGEGGIAYAPPVVKRVFVPAEVEQIRAQAYAEGERAASVRAEEAVAAALAQIAAAAHAGLGRLAEMTHEHRAACAELALATARVIAGAALDHSPEAPAVAALETMAHEIESTPRLIVRAAPDLVARLQAVLDVTAAACSFPGQILVKADATLPLAGFVFDWGDGRASFDPAQAAERVAEALRAAIAAEAPRIETPAASLSAHEAHR
ncbi:MAG TPA: flagellar assembly protein FliH [Caulobacteraceae bacterium]|jgi:flagellar assembly protein FliH|nr:flagellar assembly protein FliH [Caulobacteraceae bacterium]